MIEVYSFDEAREAWGKLHDSLRTHGMESMTIDTLAAYFAAPEKWITVSAPPAMDREAVELDWRLVAKLAGEHGVRYRTNRAFEQFVTAILSTLSADAIRQGEGVTLALRAIKAVTATAKDGAAGLSRIMAIASAAGVKQQYSELLQDPDVALIVERPRTEWAHLFKPGIEGCALPPDGWQCSRARGHSGPCAATPASHASDGGKA